MLSYQWYMHDSSYHQSLNRRARIGIDIVLNCINEDYVTLDQCSVTFLYYYFLLQW